MDHLKQVEKSLGRKPKELAEQPTLLPKLVYLWHMFLDIKSSVDGSIGYPDLRAYSSFYGELTPFEVDIIRLLDNLRKEAQS